MIRDRKRRKKESRIEKVREANYQDEMPYFIGRDLPRSRQQLRWGLRARVIQPRRRIAFRARNVSASNMFSIFV